MAQGLQFSSHEPKPEPTTMPDAIAASPQTSSPVMDKTASMKRESADSAGSGGKDFAATLDSVREQKRAEAANKDAQAANQDLQAANKEPQAANQDAQAANNDLQPTPPDPAVAELAAAMMPIVSPETAVAPATAVAPKSMADTAPDGTDDPATAAGALAALGSTVTRGITPAPTPSAKAGELAMARLRPESRAAAQWPAVAASTQSPTKAAPNAQASVAAPEQATSGLGRADGELPDFKLALAEAGTKTQDASVTSPDGKSPEQTTATTSADQNQGTTATRERDARSEVLKLDTRLPIQSPRFGEGFSQQVVVLAQHGVQQAQMTINPPDLGPIEVRITIQHDQASVQIAAASGLARDVIQDALPKLREMMDQSGVRLNDAGVFSQLPQREQSAFQSQPQRQEWLFNAPAGQRSMTEEASLAPRQARRVGLIDAYA
jgi:flagellar hook-length control protein FliK